MLKLQQTNANKSKANSQDTDGNNIKVPFNKCQENDKVKLNEYFDEADLTQCYVVQPSEFTRKEGQKEYDVRIYLQKNDLGSIISIPFTKN